jgi:hypothetical protein
MAKLDRAAVMGVAQGLFDAGAAVARTPDPDCDAAGFFGDGASWSDLAGLPGYGETEAATASQESFRDVTLNRLDALIRDRSRPGQFDVPDQMIRDAASRFWRAADIVTRPGERHQAVMWAVTLEELGGASHEAESEASARLREIADRATQPE